MSKESQMIDPAGRCVHDRIERVGTDVGYTNQWLCRDCREEFYHLDWKANGKLTIMEPFKTLRDEFAIAAMQGDWASQSLETREIPNDIKKDWLINRARLYYALSDIMLEVRK
jgi:hypothetical protein